ncbi:hypothetical protein J0895_03780 [Phormidium pseudopriestleyi FRX01]|uniref:Uncharacterized protein n=1 Tax=Phormidium pseudopriestleyi FRX01 TaxID=1759528 RepID=A0ABS3FMB6_9CYAN|nr:hypothetical protein [Phormidium pseudopriestleyi]MBO0348235.1 hypothetical protein [Phormidium pseudopriestleyi FRX01]
MTEREYAIAKRLGTRIALILSEEPTDPPPQGFDKGTAIPIWKHHANNSNP